MAQPRICQGGVIYVYIYTGRVCICARARRRCGVRRLVSKTSRAGVLEAGRFDGYGLSRTGIDGDTQEAIWSSPVRCLVVSSWPEQSRGEASLAQALAANRGRAGAGATQSNAVVAARQGVEAPAGQRASKAFASSCSRAELSKRRDREEERRRRGGEIERRCSSPGWPRGGDVLAACTRRSRYQGLPRQKDPPKIMEDPP
ncbi:hypothetical protein CI102_1088 [Trichoderma harzianum]|uniref:Uncharacterized protein n=1 Tax=Trichoderma harzianum CBS 226.95 TaxID=983964 RepID=A0A2T4AV38_TRIHA|nr:hypothetical protein M431DRAFT_200391 [Trichoderma harzianum CBS 226.95]PKK54474.1 hypothetical protein CI102_1088 [Trichoderma harzianum]PTB60933.1 hypothetical protein M431DRAFT_200391 [Trichoderma harzianum CBS 226.95]